MEVAVIEGEDVECPVSLREDDDGGISQADAHVARHDHTAQICGGGASFP
jgi:hypothetical protein